MSNDDRIAVIANRDPFETSNGQWARVLGVLKCSQITLKWTQSFERVQEEAARRWWKWNLVVCVLDSTCRHAVPLILCDNKRLGEVVHTFVSVSATHIREGGFIRSENPLGKINVADVELDNWDDAARDALSDAIATLSPVDIGQVMAGVRCHCLLMILRGEPVTMATIQSAVVRLLPAKTKPKSKNNGRKQKRKRVEYSLRDEEQIARLLEFFRLKTCRTYSSKELQTRTVVSPFTARAFVRNLDQFYRDGHPGYMQTVARYADGLPPWDRIFAEEWRDLGIQSRPPPPGEKMVLLQYPNANGMGYSFAVCIALELQRLISSTDNPTFSEVYREDLALTAIPIDWDMAVSDVIGPKWYPGIWLECIQSAADAALRKLLPIFDETRPTRQIVHGRMWVSEEMMAALSSDGGVLVEGLDKVTAHANLLLPQNVILWNYKVLRIVYEEMERQYKACTSTSTAWHLDKSITKLRLPGCFKRNESGSYVRRLVPWSNLPASAYDALAHAKHEIPPLDGVDMAIIRAPPCQRTSRYNVDGSGVPLDEAVEIVRRTLCGNQETASLELATSTRQHPFIGVRKRTDGNNWCIIKGGPHRNATMYFVVGRGKKAWIHCHSDRCKSKREKNKSKPYVDLCTSSICWKDS